ncbi:unnamed protein product, partial [Haemonchus placei]|uniref:Secreted protein n=1 Tax=Haemonchus placei TaxID=6290 RepID=A0A0N4W3Y0_HAEPC
SDTLSFSRKTSFFSFGEDFLSLFFNVETRPLQIFENSFRASMSPFMPAASLVTCIRQTFVFPFLADDRSGFFRTIDEESFFRDRVELEPDGETPAIEKRLR